MESLLSMKFLIKIIVPIFNLCLRKSYKKIADLILKWILIKRYLEAIWTDDKFEEAREFFIETNVEEKLDLWVKTCKCSEEKLKEGSNVEKEIPEKYTALEGLRKFTNEQVILFGRPGSGKTTTLHQLLLEETKKVKKDPETKIPVLIELKLLSKTDSKKESVLEQIQNSFLRGKIELETKNIEKMLLEGRLLLLVDGLNELPSEEARQAFINFHQTYKDIPMVITSRELGSVGSLGIEKKLEMQPLEPEQVKNFVKSRLNGKADIMLNSLKGERFEKIQETPLFLKMLCDIFETPEEETPDKETLSKLPENLGFIFRKFINNTYIYKLKALITSSDWDLWQKMLEYLSFKMIESDGKPTSLILTLDRDEAEILLTQFLENKKYLDLGKEARHQLDNLLKYHLIKIIGDREIEFSHQLIQEYFAAEYLLKLLPKLEGKKLEEDYLNYTKWTESLALALDLLEDREIAIKIVEKAIDIDCMLAAKLAGSVKKDFQNKTVSLIEEINIPKKFKIFLLGKTKSEEAVNLLKEFVNDPDDNVRLRVVYALGEIESSKSRELLYLFCQDSNQWIQTITKWELDGDEYYRVSGIKIGPDKDPTILQHLIFQMLLPMSKVSGKEYVREIFKNNWEQVESTLNNIYSTYEVKELWNFYLNGNCISRCAVTYKLAELKQKDLIVKILLNDRENLVKYCAIYELDRFFSSPDPDIEIILILALFEGIESTKMRAIFALQKFGTPRSIPELIKFMKINDSQVDWWIYSTIKEINDKCKFYNYEIEQTRQKALKKSNKKLKSEKHESL